MTDNRARLLAILERRALLTELDDALDEIVNAVEATAKEHPNA
jgi:hypothetical protein